MSNWKEIPDAPGYFVSRFGDVFSTKSGRELKPGPDTGGYFYFTAQVGGRHKYYRIHRAVAAAFIGPCPEGQEVRHLNGDKTDNRVENLRYGTKKENEADKIAHGTTARGRRHGRSKLTPDDVVAIRRDPRRQRVIAEAFGISQGLVHQIRSRKIWKHV